jgi:tol-pal system protein YbgF
MLIRAFCLLLLIGSSTAQAGLFGDDKARDQIEALRQQVAQLEARIAQMEATLKGEALVEMYTQVETLGLELGKLRGQIEVLNNDNASLQKRQRDFYIDLDNRLRQIEQPGAPPPTYTDPAAGAAESSSGATAPADEIIDAPHGTRITTHPQPEESPAAQTSASQESAAAETVIAAIPGQSLQPAGATEKQFYDAAYRQFVSGDYAGARSQFQTFLEHHPQSNLAPSAAYWIGNAHYALRDYQQAIAAQRNLITRYPDSAKVPDAMLNIASSQTELADKKAAKQTLEELIARYPFSGAAEKAKQRLTRLN